MLAPESDLVQQRKCIDSRGLRMNDKTDGCHRTGSRPYQFEGPRSDPVETTFDFLARHLSQAEAVTVLLVAAGSIMPLILTTTEGLCSVLILEHHHTQCHP